MAASSLLVRTNPDVRRDPHYVNLIGLVIEGVPFVCSKICSSSFNRVLSSAGGAAAVGIGVTVASARTVPPGSEGGLG
jgi:hypothetical protein